MVDRAALEDLVAKHAEDMSPPSGYSLLLHLIDGETYSVNSFVEFLENYFVVRVYSQEAIEGEDVAKHYPKNSKGRPIYDRMVLPYAAIKYLTITARERARKNVGFVDK